MNRREGQKEKIIIGGVWIILIFWTIFLTFSDAKLKQKEVTLSQWKENLQQNQETLQQENGRHYLNGYFIGMTQMTMNMILGEEVEGLEEMILESLENPSLEKEEKIISYMKEILDEKIMESELKPSTNGV